MSEEVNVNSRKITEDVKGSIPDFLRFVEAVGEKLRWVAEEVSKGADYAVLFTVVVNRHESEDNKVLVTGNTLGHKDMVRLAVVLTAEHHEESGS